MSFIPPNAGLTLLPALRDRIAERLGRPAFWQRVTWIPFGNQGRSYYESDGRGGHAVSLFSSARAMLSDERRISLDHRFKAAGVSVSYSYQSDPIDVRWNGREVSEEELVLGWAKSKGILPLHSPPSTKPPIPSHLTEYAGDPRLCEPGYRLLSLGEPVPNISEGLFVPFRPDDRWTTVKNLVQGSKVTRSDVAYRVPVRSSATALSKSTPKR